MLVEWGGDGWNYTDNYMTGRTNGVATYRNSDFFGLVDGLSFALQYRGKTTTTVRFASRMVTASAPQPPTRSTTVSHCLQATPALTVASIRKLTAMATKPKHGRPLQNMTLTTSMRPSCTPQTYNMTPEEDNHFAGKTQNFEAVVQYQFDFGLRPSIGYVQTKGKDLQSRAGFSGGDADLVKYIEVGTGTTLTRT